jgi:hypothetical protein
MDAATLQVKVASGYCRAALRLGTVQRQFRPVAADNPTAGIPRASMLAAFDQAEQFTFARPWDRRRADGFALMDTTDVQPGDYLVGADTYFVSRFEPFRPASVVLCDQVLTITASSGAAQTGLTGYSGRTTGTDIHVAGGWPASVLARGAGQIPPTALPDNVRAAWFEILLPPMPGVVLSPTMRATDEGGTVYLVSTVESTDFGWKLLASVATS